MPTDPATLPDSDDPPENWEPRGFWPALKVAFRNVVHNPWIVVLALVAAGLAFAMGWVVQIRDGADPGSPLFLEHQLARAFLLFLPALLLLLFRCEGWWQVLVAAVVCVTGAVVWLQYDLRVYGITAAQSVMGEVPVPQAYQFKLILTVAGILSPILIVWAYQRTTILDRHLIREFIQPFFFCLIAFFSIWLIFDLNDNLSDFRKHQPSPRDILTFYAVQVPHIFTKIAQAAVLIATVYALSKMSRAHEFIAILGSGRSLGRTLLPLFLIGVYISFIFLVFNYDWAPRGEERKESLLDEFSGDRKDAAVAKRHLFLNREAGRTWYIGEIPFDPGRQELRIVDIQQEDAEGRRVRALHAASATWDHQTRLWQFNDVYVSNYAQDGRRTSVQKLEILPVQGWTETPWQLVNRRLEPDFLGVKDLLSYVKTSERDGQPRATAYLTNLHHRLAAPWSCLTIIFIAAPLGIVFSRRGILGGVASAIFLFGAILFLTELFVALGKAGILPPALAAWLTNGIFLLVGSVFLYLRARNRTVRLPRILRRPALA